MSALKHPNIGELSGAAWVREPDLQALFEYIDNDDLRTYLSGPALPKDWDSYKLEIAIDIAEALAYVHSFTPPLMRRDLKSRNLLLNSEIQAKLTDFGVSRYRSGENTITIGVGTGRWLTPEVIAGDGTYGTTADIFSFGALFLELNSHQIPYEDARGSNGMNLPDIALLQRIMTGELKPSISAECLERIADCCLLLSPADRPHAAEVAYTLRTFRKSMRETFHI